MNFVEIGCFFVLGYFATVAIELPVLTMGLSKKIDFADRIKLSFLLTATTYPMVVLVFPALIWAPFGQTAYLAIAETFALLIEIAYFRMLTQQKLLSGIDQNAFTILIANLGSFLVGWAFLGNLLYDFAQTF